MSELEIDSEIFKKRFSFDYDPKDELEMAFVVKLIDFLKELGVKWTVVDVIQFDDGEKRPQKA